MKLMIGLLAGILCCGATFADNSLFKFEFEELAPGVWAGVRPIGHRFPVMGNSTFVISEDGVVVFDGGGTPGMADQLIQKIRSLTDVPVTHVVTSHWHGDHNFGIYRFAEEFADVQFIAHRFTAAVMDSPRIAYIDRSAGYLERNRELFETIVATGKDADGKTVSAHDQMAYKDTLDNADVIQREYDNVKVTPPNVIIDDEFTIQSGSRTVRLLHLGHANTAGDIVMWLPEERIVATGDIVVLPTPYAFNVPPRPWAQTMRNIRDLDYKTMVPGHGAIQHDTEYLDLLVAAADSIADQRDAMLADGMSNEEVQAALDFSEYEMRLTGGDDYIKVYYEAWFEGPLRAAAMKALTGEPMVSFAGPEEIAFDDERWLVTASESEQTEHLGQEALRIRGGMAVLKEAEFRNAIVEFDIATTGERGFAGLVFRLQDLQNYEHFYIRPHQSGNPDANQYTPVFNGLSAWQLYHGDGYGAPVTYRKNEWMHVKIVFANDRADVYIDSDTPVMRVHDLKRDALAGSVGVNAADFAPAWFANFTVAELADAYELPAPGPQVALMRERLIGSWGVSDAFAVEEVATVVELNRNFMEDRSWMVLGAEPSGLANLASTSLAAGGPDTKVARVFIESDRDQGKALALGYSDAAMVFVNGKLQYRGDNTYMSRDYRYLGTIGLFDTVILPLTKGSNEICIVVTEAFGGWGIMAELADLEGIVSVRP